MYKNIPSKYLQSFHLPNNIQVIPIEVNLKQRGLLLFHYTDLQISRYNIYESETSPELGSFLDEQKCKKHQKQNLF